MQDNQAINKARALYYNLFANFFVYSKETEKYFELIRLINILKESPLDASSGKALETISESLDPISNVKLVQEYDDLFHNPINKKIRTTASFYDEGVESGKKRVEMIQFLGKTKIRRDEKEYFEYEDSIGFIFSVMAELTDLVANDEKVYENTVHCIFSEILNDFVDEFGRDVYENPSATIYKELMVVLHSFVAFERLYLEVSKPKPKERVEEAASCDAISDAEQERRAKNKALRAKGPKKGDDEEEPKDMVYDVEEDI